MNNIKSINTCVYHYHPSTTKSSALCIYHSPFSSIIIRLFSFHIVEHTTNQPRHILFKNQHNCHHSITYPSYFHNISTQHLLQHNSHTTNSISFYGQTQLTSPSPSSCPLNLICKQHTSIILFLSSPQTSPFHTGCVYSTSQPTPDNANQATHHIASYVRMLQDVG